MQNLNIKWVDQDEMPMDLLLLADPDEEVVFSYFMHADSYLGTMDGEIAGGFVLMQLWNTMFEIMNIAVYPAHQRKGIGVQLLRFAQQEAKRKGAKRLRICTADTSKHQVKLYEKVGFSITEIDKDYFIKVYEEPIFENGKQCVDRVVMEMDVM